MQMGKQVCKITMSADSRAARGFSLLELIVVLSIAMVLSAIGIPIAKQVIDTTRIRSTLSEASNLAQACRTEAIKRNGPERLHFTGTSGKVVLFVTPAASTATVPILGDPKQLSLANQFAIVATPSGAGAPPALTGTTMWGSSITPLTGSDPYFNSRGLPCFPNNAGVCVSTTGFVYYFTYLAGSTTRWSAISISPAGRIKSWFWNGKSWGS